MSAPRSVAAAAEDLAAAATGSMKPSVDLRVLHVINTLRLEGGAENSTVQLVGKLQSYGVGSRVVVLEQPAGEGVAILRAAGVEVIEAVGGPLRRYRMTRRQIRVYRPDLVHATLFHAGVVGRLAALSTSTPAVTSWVSMPHAGSRPSNVAAWKFTVVDTVDRALHKWATTAVHANSEAAAQANQKYLSFGGERVTVIPRGRDRALLGEPSEQRRKAVRAQLALSDEATVLLNVGRQHPQKGQPGLVAAFAAVHACRPEAVLVIAGAPGAATEALHEAIVAHGVQDSVRLLGHRSDVADLLCAADVFVFSSLSEGFSGAVLEAMAMEVPVVSYDIAPVLEAVADTARLVPVADTDALAAGVLEVLEESPESRRRRVLAARARFECHYTVEAMVRATAQWYGRLTSAARAPRDRRRAARRAPKPGSR